MVEDYFLRFWATLNPRTKTTIVSIFQAFASPFLYGELFQRCCTGVSLDLRATHHGKLILMDTPAESSESNLVMQVLTKAAWQLATRRRRLTRKAGLAVCYADEAALYAASGDGPFLAIARNRKATMVYIGHAIPEFAEKIGQNATNNLLSHFRTKIFHATNEPETARYAVELIGATWQPRLTRTHTENHTAGGAMGLFWNEAIRMLADYYGFSWGVSVSVTDQITPQVLPHELQPYAREVKPTTTWSMSSSSNPAPPGPMAKTSYAPPSARTSPGPVLAYALSSVAESIHPAGARLTAQNPRRHAAGKPFHAFLIGWHGPSDRASLRFRNLPLQDFSRHHLHSTAGPPTPKRKYQGIPQGPLPTHSDQNEMVCPIVFHASQPGFRQYHFLSCGAPN
jgi:hypothetical protein